MAQNKATLEIGTVKQKDKMVAFTINSSHRFVVGGNTYVLHIGPAEFAHYKQSFKSGVGSLVFQVPVAAYNSLKDGNSMYLTYGHKDESEKEMEAQSKEAQGSVWSLGKFSTKLLTK